MVRARFDTEQERYLDGLRFKVGQQSSSGKGTASESPGEQALRPAEDIEHCAYLGLLVQLIAPDAVDRLRSRISRGLSKCEAVWKWHEEDLVNR